MPVIRVSPEDFVVDEIPLYPPCGEGDHTFVRVEKSLCTSEEVARALARAADVAPREVGYAGRKDRRAVARQWFSVPGFDPAHATKLVGRGFRVLEAIPHRHKLRTAQLQGNRFEIVVREIEAVCRETLARQFQVFTEKGFPNRFGGQRFGRDGDNVDQARALLQAGKAPRNRRHARFAVSALQAELFNACLADRSAALDAVECGDIAVVEESGGVFAVEDLERELPRAARYEISATGPLFGSRMRAPAGVPAEREQAVLEKFGMAELDWGRIPGVRVRGARRPVRSRPTDAEFCAEADHFRFRFALPSGAYATVLLEELFASQGLGIYDDMTPQRAVPSAPANRPGGNSR